MNGKSIPNMLYGTLFAANHLTAPDQRTEHPDARTVVIGTMVIDQGFDISQPVAPTLSFTLDCVQNNGALQKMIHPEAIRPELVEEGADSCWACTLSRIT